MEYSNTRQKSINLEINTLEEIVLTILSSKKCYGTEMIEIVSDASEGKKQLNYGSLYPTLYKLKKRGLIEEELVENNLQERGGHLRKYYKITDLGIKSLTQTDNFRQNLRLIKQVLNPSIS